MTLRYHSPSLTIWSPHANNAWRRRGRERPRYDSGIVIALRELMLAMLLALCVGIQLLEASVTCSQTRLRFVCWNSPPHSLRI
jgi:hypothetical protein